MNTVLSVSRFVLVGAVVLAACSLRVTGQSRPQSQDGGVVRLRVDVGANRQTPTPEEQEKHRLAAWERRLALFAATEHATVFFDIPEVSQALTVDLSRPYGVEGMKAMATATYRTWKQVGGVQVFSRFDELADRRACFNAMLDWLESLSNTQLSTLGKGSQALSQLDVGAQDVVRGFVGYDPSLSLLLLDNYDKARMAVDITPRFTFVDPRSGQPVTAELNQRLRPNALAGSKPAKSAVVRPRSIIALNTPDLGKLDFGVGKILPLQQILARAEAVFGTQFDADGRIQNSNYFISGAYTAESFSQALALVTAVPPISHRRPADDISADVALLKAKFKSLDGQKIDTTWLRDNIPHTTSQEIDSLGQKFGNSEQLNPADFTQPGNPVSASALCGNNPGLAIYLQQFGIGPNTMLTLDFGITVTIGCPGDHSLETGWNGTDWGVQRTFNQISMGTYR